MVSSSFTRNNSPNTADNCEFLPSIEDLDVCDRATEESRKVSVGYAFEPRISGEVIQGETGRTSYRDAYSDDSDFDPDTGAQEKTGGKTPHGVFVETQENVFVVGKSLK